MTDSFLAKKVCEILKYYNIRARTYLDLGCGSGEPTLLIAKCVGAEEVYGLDVVESISRKDITKICKLRFKNP